MLVVGLMMVFSPETCLRIMVVLLGATVFVNGLFNLTKLRGLVKESVFSSIITIRGLFCLVVGLAAMLLPIFFVRVVGTIITVLLYVLAVSLILSAISELVAVLKVQSSIKIKPYIYEAASSIVVAILLFMLAPGIESKLTVVFGIIICLLGLFALLHEWFNRKRIVLSEKEIKVRDADESPEMLDDSSASEQD